MITNAALHHTILKGIIDNGFAPSIQSLSEKFNCDKDIMIIALNALQDYHGVVLHPHNSEVWVIHPFSLAPTNFYVQTDTKAWWGNCAWCSLGIAALLKKDVTITTTLGAETEQVQIHIKDGEILEKDYYIHFPIPMQNAWDNVIYTCSNMLLFKKESEIDHWVKQHNIPKGDVQPIDNIWQFSKQWYGNHLNPEWTKWTVQEAKEMFVKYNLRGETWDLGDSKERF